MSKENDKKYIMKLSGSVINYGYDKRYNKNIKERIFSSQNETKAPLCYDNIHEIGLLAGETEIKEDENGVSAVCYICNTPYGRHIKELIDSNLQFELGACVNMVETITHGNETIVTKGVILEISIIPVENAMYPVKIEQER